MPRTRSDLARSEKLEAILDAAEDAIRSRGFDGCSIAALARQLGVAQNSIYWYVGDKDGLLLAVLERSTKRSLDQLAGQRARRPVDQIVATVDHLAELRPLEAAMRLRAPHDERVAAFERTFDSSLRSLLRDVLRPVVPAADLDEIADAVEVAARGALAMRLGAKRRRRLLGRTIEALCGSG